MSNGMGSSMSVTNRQDGSTMSANQHLWEFLKATTAGVMQAVQDTVVFIKKFKATYKLDQEASIDWVKTEYNHADEARHRPYPAVWDRELSHPIAKSIMSMLELDQGPSAIVIVGAQEVHFSMSMSLLFHYSKTAERMLNGGFSESASNIIRIPDHEPNTFAVFKAWIMQGEVRAQECCQDFKECYESRSINTLNNTCMLLCELYVFLDYMDVRYWKEMREEILQQLSMTEWALNGTPVLPDTVLYVFRHTPPESELRSFMVEHLLAAFTQATEPPVQQYTKCIEEFSVEFGAKIMTKSIMNSRTAPDDCEDMC